MLLTKPHRLYTISESRRIISKFVSYGDSGANGAYLAQTENERGSITKGKWADFIVIAPFIIVLPNARQLGGYVIGDKKGSIDNFLEKELDLTAEEKRILRDKFLENR